VCLAVASDRGASAVENVITGNRSRVREQAVHLALAMLLDAIATRGDEHDISAEQS
jgi:nicotinamide mononucleotide (NMN) deamidase PncC